MELEQYAFLDRATGSYWWAYTIMMTCNVISPQLMWFKKLRRNILFTFILALFVHIGMWFERFVIITLHEMLPSSCMIILLRMLRLERLLVHAVFS